MSESDEVEKELFISKMAEGADYDLRQKTIRGEVISDLIISCSRGESSLPRGLQLRNGKIVGELNLEAVRFPFPIYMKNCGFEAPVILRSMESKTISFEGSSFQSVIDARDCKIDGQVVLRQCVFNRPVLFRDSNITGMLNTLGASFIYDPNSKAQNWMEEHAWGDSFSIARSHIGSLNWREIAHRPLGNLNLSDATLGSLKCDLTELEYEKSYPSKGKVLLDGLNFEHIEKNDVSLLIKFYELMPNFCPSSWKNLAISLKNSGLEHDADKIVAVLRKLEIQQMSSIWKRVFYRTIFILTGYGIHPERALFAAILCCSLIFCSSKFMYSYGYLSPKVNNLVSNRCYYSLSSCEEPKKYWKQIVIMPSSEVRNIPLDYPEFSPVKYSLETLLPFTKGSQTEYWQSSLYSLDILNRFLSSVAFFLSGLFFGTVSGLFFPKAKTLS